MKDKTRNKILNRVNNGNNGSETRELEVYLQTSLLSEAVRHKGAMGTQVAEGESGDAGRG